MFDLVDSSHQQCTQVWRAFTTIARLLGYYNLHSYIGRNMITYLLRLYYYKFFFYFEFKILKNIPYLYQISIVIGLFAVSKLEVHKILL